MGAGHTLGPQLVLCGALARQPMTVIRCLPPAESLRPTALGGRQKAWWDETVIILSPPPLPRTLASGLWLMSSAQNFFFSSVTPSPSRAAVVAFCTPEWPSLAPRVV